MKTDLDKLVELLDKWGVEYGEDGNSSRKVVLIRDSETELDIGFEFHTHDGKFCGQGIFYPLGDEAA